MVEDRCPGSGYPAASRVVANRYSLRPVFTVQAQVGTQASSYSRNPAKSAVRGSYRNRHSARVESFIQTGGSAPAGGEREKQNSKNRQKYGIREQRKSLVQRAHGGIVF